MSSTNSPGSDRSSSSASPISVRSSSACPTLLRSDQPGHVKSELERLSIQAVELIMQKQWQHPLLQSFTTNFKSVHDGGMLVGRDKLYEHFLTLSNMYPERRSKAIDACAEVDERRGRAKVWMIMNVSGLPGGIVKEGASMFCWERRNGIWFCFKHVGMGGEEFYT